MITIISQGDNNYREDFRTEQEAYQFLQSLVDRVKRYYEEGADGDFCFDVEDDMITWIEGRKRKYCAGWHWLEFQEKKPIVMPDGRKLYDIFYELEM